MRVIPTFGIDCILGVDFLPLFGFEIDFGKSKFISPAFTEVQFFETSRETPETCAGLRQLTDTEKEQVDDLVKRLVVQNDDILPACNLATHDIDVGDSEPTRNGPRRYSPALLQVAHAVAKLLK